MCPWELHENLRDKRIPFYAKSEPIYAIYRPADDPFSQETFWKKSGDTLPTNKEHTPFRIGNPMETSYFAEHPLTKALPDIMREHSKEFYLWKAQKEGKGDPGDIDILWSQLGGKDSSNKFRCPSRQSSGGLWHS